MCELRVHELGGWRCFLSKAVLLELRTLSCLTALAPLPGFPWSLAEMTWPCGHGSWRWALTPMGTVYQESSDLCSVREPWKVLYMASTQESWKMCFWTNFHLTMKQNVWKWVRRREMKELKNVTILLLLWQLLSSWKLGTCVLSLARWFYLAKNNSMYGYHLGVLLQ